MNLETHVSGLSNIIQDFKYFGKTFKNLTPLNMNGMNPFKNMNGMNSFENIQPNTSKTSNPQMISSKIDGDPVKQYDFRDFMIIRRSGNIIKYKGDAIVNAANEPCLGGGGIDGAISAAGGVELDKMRRSLPIITTNKGVIRCPMGDAKITTLKGKKPNDWKLGTNSVIHAVGPNYNNYPFSHYSKLDKALENVYINIIDVCNKNKIKSVAIPTISGQIYRGKHTVEHMIDICVNTVINRLKKRNSTLTEITFYSTDYADNVIASHMM